MHIQEGIVELTGSELYISGGSCPECNLAYRGGSTGEFSAHQVFDFLWGVFDELTA